MTTPPHACGKAFFLEKLRDVSSGTSSDLGEGKDRNTCWDGRRGWISTPNSSNFYYSPVFKRLSSEEDYNRDTPWQSPRTRQEAVLKALPRSLGWLIAAPSVGSPDIQAKQETWLTPAGSRLQRNRRQHGEQQKIMDEKNLSECCGEVRADLYSWDENKKFSFLKNNGKTRRNSYKG